MACNHNQCFDATSYLQLQDQAPTWICPVCNKSATWDNLGLDQYVQSILDTTSRETEQVTVEPDGKWSTAAQSHGTNRASNPTPSDDDGDDDLIEVTGTFNQSATVNPFKALTPSSVRTPPINSSREDSSSAPRTGSKRPRPEVIEISDDDEEEDQEPIRPVKRPSLGSSMTRPPDRYQFSLQPPLPPPSPFDPMYPQGFGNNNPTPF